VLYLMSCLGVMFVTTALTRTVPFLFAERLGAHPRFQVLGKQLPASIMVLLSIQCLCEVDYLQYPYGLCELLASGLVLALHSRLRNSLLSIGAGTLAYGLLTHLAIGQAPQ